MTRRPLEHGTRHGYAHHKCRCGPCVEANADYTRRLRAVAQVEAYCPICCVRVNNIFRHEEREHR